MTEAIPVFRSTGPGVYVQQPVDPDVLDLREYLQARALRPAEALALAVLEHSLGAILKRAAGSRSRREEIRWLRDGEDRPFSFVWVCDVLHISPPALRASILSQTGTLENRPRFGGVRPPRRLTSTRVDVRRKRF